MGTSPVRAGLKAAAQWVGVEFGFRTLGGGILALSLSLPLVSGAVFALDLVAVALTVLLLGLLFRRRIRREGLSWRALGYARLTRPVVVAGLAAGGLLLIIVGDVTQPVDLFLFPGGTKRGADLLRMLREAGILAAALLLPLNGVLGPVLEEFAWRGYVQTRLIEGLGVRNGLALTAVLFAAKHVVVDLSAFRLTSLLVFSFAVGLIRIRWGTTATTIAHVVLNLVATSFGIAEAFA